MHFGRSVGVALLMSLACSAFGQAALIGSSVTGQLRFVGQTDFFNPANGKVPAGFGNSAGSTVTLADPGVEFGYQDQYGRITADFSATRLTISEFAIDGGDATVERFTFFDDAFTNLMPVLVSNTYAATPAFGLVDDRLTVNFPDGYSTVTGNTTVLTLAITLPGDATLNGSVDFNDFLALQSNFGHTGTTFTQGNFNSDNTTDFNDFLILQSNFGHSIVGPGSAFTAAEVAAINAFASANVVPEPASFAMLGLASSALLRRRRRV